MREFARLQLYYHETSKQPIVKHQIGKELIIF